MLTESEYNKERADALYHIAYCLHNKPEPEWDKAIEAYQKAMDLLTESKYSKDRASALNQIAYCLHTKPEPEWDEAIETYRKAAELLTESEHNKDRSFALLRIAYCLHSKPEPEWDEAIETYQKAAELLTNSEEQENYAYVLHQIAYCLRIKPEPDWEKAIETYKETIKIKENPNSIIGLMICHDAIGDFKSADNLMAKLQAEDIDRGSSDKIVALAERRNAYFALRSGDRIETLAIAESLKDSSENAKAMLISAIVHFADEDEQAFLQKLSYASPSMDDKLWARGIAIGYFARFDIPNISQFLDKVMSANESR